MDFSQAIKRLQIITMLCGVLATLLLTVFLIAHNYKKSREDTIVKLRLVETNLQSLREKTVDIRGVLARLKGYLPPESERRSPELMLYFRMDDIKSRFPGADMTISGIEDKDEELRIPFALRTTYADYNKFLNDLGQIQASVLPVVHLKGVSVSRSEDLAKPAVVFAIDGTLKILKNWDPGKPK